MIKSIGLIITTFNQPEALRAVLSSVCQQTRIPDQVIVVDDGSTYITRNIVRMYEKELPLTYCWQPDMNFRVSRSRNLGISKNRAEYLIFIDGDCLLPSDFIKQHLELSHPDKMIAGSRILLSKTKTDKIFNSLNDNFQQILGGYKHYHIPLGFIRDLKKKDWELVRTCNVSLHTERVLSVYGFDENYVGWGLEDSDFVVRLIRTGCTIRSGRLAVCVNHLFHIENERTMYSTNHERFKILLRTFTLKFDTKSILRDN